MKLLQLAQCRKKDGTGGIRVEQYLYKAIESVFNTNIDVLTDSEMGVERSKIGKLFSYWRERKRIEKVDFLLANTSNRRLCFFLNYIKKRNENIYIMVIHHHFEFLGHRKGTLKRWFCKLYEMNILKASDCIVTFGDYTRDMLLQYMPNKHIECLGVPIERRQFQQSARKNGELLYIGTIERRKGIHYLIEALANVKTQFHLTLVGDYSRNTKYYKQLQEKIVFYHLGNKITFTGRISEEEKNRYLSEASIFTFPTTNEGYGIVIVEAMGHKIPVVAFDNTAIPYLVQDGVNGLLAKNRDSVDLAAKISQLLNDRQALERMGESAIETYLATVDIDEFMNRSVEMCEKIKNAYFA